jgi:hypothetical protein
MTMAHAACRYGHIEVLIKLVELWPGIVRELDEFQQTPLHQLCHNTNAKKQELKIMVEVLLNADKLIN